MKTIKTYAELQAAIKANPKATAITACSAGTIASIAVAATLTQTIAVQTATGIAFTTVKAGIGLKIGTGIVLAGATAYGSYKLYKHLTK